MVGQWGDDEYEPIAEAVVSKPVEEEAGAPEPEVGIRCSNPFCDFVFPIVNKSSFESRFMSFVLDCTTRRQDPTLGCFCPTKAMAQSRFSQVYQQLREAQSLVPVSNPKHQMYTRRMLRLQSLLQLFSTKKEDCYERFRRAEQVVSDFLRSDQGRWSYDPEEYSQYEKEELTKLARLMKKQQSGKIM
jgi:hypothetical protein